jgi:hypothetical protein
MAGNVLIFIFISYRHLHYSIQGSMFLYYAFKRQIRDIEFIYKAIFQ